MPRPNVIARFTERRNGEYEEAIGSSTIELAEASGSVANVTGSRPIALLMASILVAAACTTSGVSSASLTTIEDSPASTTIATPGNDLVKEADGYSLSVSLDRTTVAPGEVVTFTATFHNGTTEPIDYAVPWCGGAASLHVSVALPVEPSGRTWSGIAQEFKDYVLTEGYGPGVVPALAPVRIDVPARPCGEGQFEALLAPGESVQNTLPWTAEIVAGVPAVEGVIDFTVSVGYDRQNGPPSYPPDFKGPRGSWFPVYKQLEVTGTFDVVGRGKPLIGAGQVVDALLADPKFAFWLAQQPPNTWSNANLFLQSMDPAQGIVPPGPSWDLELFREIGVPRNWAIAFIDPFDASVRSVTYCDVPCDR